MDLLHNLLLALIGLSGGFAVGSGFVAFITVLDILPRLVQLTKSGSNIRLYEASIILGVLFFTSIDFYDVMFFGFKWVVFPIGLIMGLFVGMLAAALTEVVNVIPILARRLRMYDYLFLLLLAMALGKMLGSLFQWIIY